MISIFIMYSPDRKEALGHTIACLSDMELYDECQKTLIVDGKTNVFYEDWDQIQLPRLSNQFCWARMWNAGVFTAKHEKIVYLDSDRMLPTDYLSMVNELVEDKVFLYTSFLFNMLKTMSIEDCRALLRHESMEPLIKDPLAIGTIRYEIRHGVPFHGSGKNVMSGSVAFTKNTYQELGGVDPWYRGHGAFADTDFHMTAVVGGCRFVDLGIPELHYPHSKLDGPNVLSDSALWILSLDNFIYYCDKWKLPMSLAESFAVRSGIKSPVPYVRKKLKEIKEVAKECD